MDPRRRELQQRRLPGAVGSEHDPALALLDLPGDVVEQRVASPDDAHTGEGEDVAHGSRP